MAVRATLDFLKTEAAGGAALAVAALAALVWANSPAAHLYFNLLAEPFSIRIGAWAETLSVRDWIGGGLMGIFFFVIGLEVKQEVLKGELSSPRKLALPAGAALGGLVASAVVYLAFNLRAGGAPAAWPTGAASDIALVLGAMALVGRGLPEALRLFLLSLALIADVAAMALIAVLFTGHVHPWALVGAALTLAGLIGLSEWRDAPFLFRAIGFLVLGAFTLKSGLDTSVAGLAAALTVPVGQRRPDQDGVLKHFMESVHPYVAFAILPLFGFTMAGVRLAGLPPAALASPITLGVAAGLFIGKPAGVMGGAFLMIRTGLARRPTGTSWLELFGVALLCGVGFSISLYLGALAFPEALGLQRSELILGVIIGSIASAGAGMAVLALASARREAARAPRA